MAKNAAALAEVLDYDGLERIAKPLAEAVRGAYEARGEVGRQMKNLVHGVWLGHPLHPVFTDIPVGAWTAALALDAAAGDDAGMRRAARLAIGVGLVGAVGSAITGLTDWSETGGRSRRMGLVHGLLNLAATGLFAASWLERGNGGRASGRATAWAGYAIAAGSAYLGGELVFGRRIGVTHAAIEEPQEFTEVARSSDLAEGTMTRARKDDIDVLLVRQNGKVRALAHSCAHMGGPLSEGTLKDGSVVCPWHGSEFALDDGRVLNGPATQAQPRFEVRERDGAIEVKAPE
jgi:nitrite reductase/ring-hydroxylating ferredoxin subunit